MCGIFGYTGNKNAVEIILEGLKKLEYRGYDSWGIGVEVNGEFKVDKHAGKIGNAKVNLPDGTFAFGHTRWATHGGVTDINAHPHLDCTGKIAIVHNGIVENYQEIRKKLADKHKIISQTDTELVAHLIEDFRKKNTFVEAVRLAFLELRGLSAFLVASAADRTFAAVKTGSPLIIGIGKQENVIGSDVNCLLSLTRKVIFIEDNQLMEVSKDKTNLFDVSTGRKIKPKIHNISWKETTATKENFPHFMLKEIYEQPRVLGNIYHNFSERIANFAHLLRKFSRIYLVGCGTAYYAAMVGSCIFSKIGKIEIIPVAGSEFIYKEPFLDKKNTLVVFMSQSGETIDIIEPFKRIKKKGVKVAALVNVFGSSLYRGADEKIWLEAGPEVCVLSTKSFIAKIGILGLTAYTSINKDKEGREFLNDAIKHLGEVLEKKYQEMYLDQLVRLLYKKEHIYVIGRGISYPIALESALKIKEASYIHIEGFSGGELKHGPIALVEKAIPYIILAPNDETYDVILSNAMEIKARGGLIIGISKQDNEIFDYHIPVSDSGIYTMISQIVTMQLLAYKLAVKRGCDPDKPRNLAKSVTVK